MAQQDQFLKLFGPLPLHQPERDHLLRTCEALLVTRGAKTTASLAHSQPDGPDRSCLSRFFSGSWDAPALLEGGRAALRQRLREQTPASEAVYDIIDDTHNPKAPSRLCEPWVRPPACMQAVDRHFDHIAGRCRWGHSVVTSHLVCKGWSLPWEQALYRRQEDCEHAGLAFRSKIDLALAMVARFEPPHPGQSVLHAVDSWYMNGRMLAAVRARQGHQLIGTVISKTNLKMNGRKAKLSQWAGELKPEDLECVKVGATSYEVHRFEGRVFDQDAVVILATRVAGKDKAWTFILCSAAGLATGAIMAHYAVRWHIETGYWYLKCMLGFADYRLRPLAAIQRWWAQVLFTYWYLEWLRHREKLPTLADTQRRVIAQYERWWAVRLWEKTRHCASPEEVLEALNVTS